MAKVPVTFRMLLLCLVGGMVCTSLFIFFLASNALDSTDGRSSSSSAHPGDPTASAALLKADLGRARAELSRARVRAADEHHRRDSLFTKAKRLLENEVDRRQFLEKRLGVVGGGAGTGGRGLEMGLELGLGGGGGGGAATVRLGTTTLANARAFHALAARLGVQYWLIGPSLRSVLRAALAQTTDAAAAGVGGDPLGADPSRGRDSSGGRAGRRLRHLLAIASPSSASASAQRPGKERRQGSDDLFVGIDHEDWHQLSRDASVLSALGFTLLDDSDSAPLDSSMGMAGASSLRRGGATVRVLKFHHEINYAWHSDGSSSNSRGTTATASAGLVPSGRQSYAPFSLVPLRELLAIRGEGKTGARTTGGKAQEDVLSNGLNAGTLVPSAPWNFLSEAEGGALIFGRHAEDSRRRHAHKTGDVAIDAKGEHPPNHVYTCHSSSHSSRSSSRSSTKAVGATDLLPVVGVNSPISVEPSPDDEAADGAAVVPSTEDPSAVFDPFGGGGDGDAGGDTVATNNKSPQQQQQQQQQQPPAPPAKDVADEHSFIYHKAVVGERVSDLLTRYGVSLGDLEALNEGAKMRESDVLRNGLEYIVGKGEQVYMQQQQQQQQMMQQATIQQQAAMQEQTVQQQAMQQQSMQQAMQQQQQQQQGAAQQMAVQQAGIPNAFGGEPWMDED